MSEYIITCDEETASWVGNDVDAMRRLVRCRDCIYYKPYRTHSHGIMNRCYDENGHTHRRDESDFCSRGERRDA